MTEKVDRKGAQRLVDLAKEAGVDRFVMLSSIGADNPPDDNEIAHYLKAKQAADQHLEASGLTYVILRPVALTDDRKTDAVKLGDDVDQSAKAHRADVAAVVAAVLDEPGTVGQQVDLVAGNDTVADAVRALV